jgi:hypothetical protein
MIFVLGIEREMKYLNSSKNKNNTIVTATPKVFSLAAILVVAIVGVSTIPLTALDAISRA